MLLRALPLKLGLFFVFCAGALALHLGGNKHDVAQSRYEDIVAVLQSTPQRFRLIPVAMSGAPSLGYIVAPVGDSRSHSDFMTVRFDQRRRFALVLKRSPFLWQDDDSPSVLTLLDAELVGDPEMIRDMLECLKTSED